MTAGDPMTTETAAMFLRQRDEIDRAFMAWREKHGAEVEWLRAALAAIADGSLAFPPDNPADFSTPADLARHALYD